MTRREYEAFIDALLAGDKTVFKEWEANTPYFDGCMPIEVMAERGPQHAALRADEARRADNPATEFPPLAWAVVQLRQDNALGTLWNMVGFQTKLKHAEQVRVFRMIPGLENAEFARLGGLHRNTFINSPVLLDRHAAPESRAAHPLRRADHRLRRLCRKRRRRACSPACAAAAEVAGRTLTPPPPTTALGALLTGHITGGARADSFQPMNVNFGLFPPSLPRCELVMKKEKIARKPIATCIGRR
jgi:methylenetetrahydrofolate--tRNA-(uracil-5-)-methyltransferase